MSRTENALKNFKFGTLGLLVSYLFNFISRKVFIQCLPIEYLGVNGLFSNILTMLSLMELGVGTAIGFSLYKPLAFEDVQKIKLLMHFYKKAYWTIGTLVIGLGLAISPFLHRMISKDSQLPYLYLIYWLFVADSGLSYFLSYKRTLVIADQKKYIDTNYHYGFRILRTIVQMVTLIISRSYLLYLVIMVISTVSENYFISKKISHLYPYLNERVDGKLAKEDLTQIKKNIFALTFHRIGGVVVNGTDNILTVKFVNLAVAGIYSNYMLIIKALKSIVDIVYNSMIASVGNLVVEKEKEAGMPLFNEMNAVTFWGFGFCAICLFYLFNPFISLWLGSEYIFSIPIVFVITLNFYITGVLKPVRTFYSSMGLFWFDRYKPIFEAVINLVASIYLAKRMGFIGIIIGTTISSLTTICWFEPFVLFKYGFESSVKHYFFRYVRLTVGVLFAGYITGFPIRLVVFESELLEFIKNIGLCVVVPNILIGGFYALTNDMKDILSFVKKLKGFKAQG